MAKKETILQEILRGYDAARSAYKPIQDRREKNFELYTGRNPKKKYKSRANFHVPYVATLVENVWPLLTNRLPESTVVGRNHERDADAATLMEELVKYTFDINNFDWLFTMTVKDAMLFDSAWFKVCWLYQDENTDHPLIESIEPNSILVHPQKVKLDDRWPIYHRKEMTKAEMKEMGWDIRTINSLGESKLNNDNYRKERMQKMGLKVEGDNDDLYEVVEVWLKTDLSFGADENAVEEIAYFVIANEEKIINTKPFPGKKKYQSPYDHKYYPYVWLPYSPIPHSMLSESFIDPVASQQEELNALENMKADNYKLRNNPPLKVRRDSNIDLKTLRFEAGLPWLVEEMTDVEMQVIPDLATSIENQQNMIKQQMQNRTGANDVLLVSGDVGVQGGDSATGAAIADQNTKIRFRSQAQMIDSAVKRIGEIIIALYQQPTLFDRDKAIAIADEEGKFYEQVIRPDDIRGDLQFVVGSASSIAESKDAALAKYIQIRDLFLEDSNINLEEINQKIIEAADLDWNKVKKDKESQLAELAMKLQQLVAVTKRPEFRSMPTNEQTSVLTQIQQIRDLLAGGQGGAQQPNQVPAV